MKKVILLETEKEKSNFKLIYLTLNISYVDIIGNLNVVLFYSEENIYVCGIKHIQMNCLFSKEEIVFLIKTLLENNFIVVKNSKYILKYLEEVKLIDNLLDVSVYFHYTDNRNYDSEINNIFSVIKKERLFFENTLSRKINSNILTLYNLIECSSDYYDYIYSHLNFQDFESLTDKFKLSISSFNYLNKLSTNGIFDIDTIHDIGYKINSITKRPSLVSNKNYFSLSKKDDSRSSIISRYENGNIVEIDFQSYHLQLLDLYLKLFPKKDANFNYHLEFYKIIYNDFEKQTLTLEEKELVKKRIFYILYNIDVINNNDNEIIHKINLFKASLLEYYQENNHINSLYSTGKIFFDDNVTYNKVINYAIQDLETNINLKLLRSFYYSFNNRYNLILYVYDSFLFDIKDEETEEFISTINNILNGFIFSVKIGKSYDKLNLYI